MIPLPHVSSNGHIADTSREKTECRTKSFLSPPELTTSKAFVRSLIEYCSPLCAGAPASYLSQLHAVETKAFRIICISRDEVESLGLSLSHRRQVGGLSVFYRLLSGLASPPPLLCLRFVPTIFPQGTQGPPTTPIL